MRLPRKVWAPVIYFLVLEGCSQILGFEESIPESDAGMTSQTGGSKIPDASLGGNQGNAGNSIMTTGGGSQTGGAMGMGGMAGSTVAGNGGAAGNGMGGASGSPIDAGPTCPLAQPAAGGICPSGLACAYGAVGCVCSAGRSGMGTWSCSAQMCPNTTPSQGAVCDAGAAACPIGDAGTKCTCSPAVRGGTGIWSCSNAPNCPATQPDAGSTTCTPGTNCSYAGQVCNCGPQGLRWICCPAVAPNNGDQCISNGGGNCSYGGKTCTCLASQWQCFGM